MFASNGVETLVGNLEALERLTTEDVLLDDLVGVGQSHVAIPHGLRIDDDGGAVLALIETSCLVGAHGGADTSDREKALELLVEGGSAGGIATASRVTFGALVAADKDVFVELRHLGLRD